MVFIPAEFDFAFLVVDDTDCARLPEIAEVYDVLYKNGLKTNKTIWVYPPRDEPKNFGDTLSDPNYLEWVKTLQNRGFEIGLHNVGSGSFNRDEILNGLELFKNTLGSYPEIHVNHSYNPDNIYSGEERFGRVFSAILKRLYPNYKGFQGNQPGSKHFWGDVHKKHIRFSRNVELPGLDIGKYVSQVPFLYKNKKEYSNYWYPVTFAPNPWMWNKMVNPKSIEKLKRNRGAAIVYTHFGYYHMEHGSIDPNFVKSVDYLGNQNGWYVTLSEFMDYQLKHINQEKLELSELKEFYLDFISLLTRFRYRHIQKLDDYHFKKHVGIEW